MFFCLVQVNSEVFWGYTTCAYNVDVYHYFHMILGGKKIIDNRFDDSIMLGVWLLLWPYCRERVNFCSLCYANNISCSSCRFKEVCFFFCFSFMQLFISRSWEKWGKNIRNIMVHKTDLLHCIIVKFFLFFSFFEWTVLFFCWYYTVIELNGR